MFIQYLTPCLCVHSPWLHFSPQIKSNTLIKRGSLKMQGGQQVDALSDFAAAVREDPENSDIYHHRGQVSDNIVSDRRDM